MDNRFKAIYSDFELSIALHGIDADGELWFKPLTFETVETPVTSGWFKVGVQWGSSWLRLHEYAQGTPFSQWGDLVG